MDFKKCCKLLLIYFSIIFKVAANDLDRVWDEIVCNPSTQSKEVLHKLYSDNKNMRKTIREKIRYLCQDYLDGKEVESIEEVLEVYQSISSGFNVPLKEEHLSMKNEILIPIMKNSNPGCKVDQIIQYILNSYNRKNQITEARKKAEEADYIEKSKKVKKTVPDNKLVLFGNENVFNHEIVIGLTTKPLKTWNGMPKDFDVIISNSNEHIYTVHDASKNLNPIYDFKNTQNNTVAQLMVKGGPFTRLVSNVWKIKDRHGNKIGHIREIAPYTNSYNYDTVEKAYQLYRPDGTVILEARGTWRGHNYVIKNAQNKILANTVIGYHYIGEGFRKQFSGYNVKIKAGVDVAAIMLLMKCIDLYNVDLYKN